MNLRCPFCDQPHYAIQCKLELKAKLDIVKKDGRCLKCLRVSKHRVNECREPKNCSKCGDSHHAAVCKKLQQQPENQSAVPQGMVLPVFARQDRSTGEKLFSGVFTKTATVEIQGEDGWHRAMCYVDEGASVSMIQQKIADKAK